MFCSTGEQNIWTKHSSEKYELREREREREPGVNSESQSKWDEKQGLLVSG